MTMNINLSASKKQYVHNFIFAAKYLAHKISEALLRTEANADTRRNCVKHNL